MRFDLPNLLRDLAQLDERESTGVIFNRISKGAHALNDETNDIIALYKECAPYLALKSEEGSNDANNMNANMATGASNMNSNMNANSGNINMNNNNNNANTNNNMGNMNMGGGNAQDNNNMYQGRPNPALAAQRSIQSFMQSGLQGAR